MDNDINISMDKTDILEENYLVITEDENKVDEMCGAPYPKNPSGAQWRKIRKQLREREEEEKNTESLLESFRVECSRQAAMVGTNYQEMEETSGSQSLSKKRPAAYRYFDMFEPPKKRTNGSSSINTSQATTSNYNSKSSKEFFKAYVTCDKYFEQQMPEFVAVQVKREITTKIYKMISEGSNFIPRFKDSFLFGGVVTFICADLESKSWLEDIAFTLTIEGQTWRVSSDRGFKLHRMTVFRPREINNTDSFLKIVQGQNPGLETHKWIVKHEGPKGDGTLIVLGVDGDSLNVLQENNFRAFAGVKEVDFRLHENQSI